MGAFMGLKQVQAPQVEPVSLLQAKVFLHIDTNAEDDLLARLIKTARQGAESYTGRSFIKQAWSFTFNAGFASARSDEAYLGHQHARATGGIELPRSPFIELIGRPCALTPSGKREMTGYRLDSSGRVARLHVSGSEHSQDVIQVDFWCGYGESPEDVPEPLRQAVLMTVANLYEARGAANDAGLIPMPLSTPVIQMIKPYRIQRLFS
jgi:uncharacterized phiE125 gp8 family phage protein